MKPRGVLLIAACAALAACGEKPVADDAAPTIDITGAGATFPFPIYRQWISDYSRTAGVRINYMSVGSTEGLRLLAAGLADFGASEREPSATELWNGTCARIVVPMLAGGIAVVYRVPGVTEPLRFDRATLRGIFDGRINAWNAPPVAALNPGVKLPALPIQVVHRAAGSATSMLFAKYLRGAPNSGEEGDPKWRAGTPVEGNEGVAAQVQMTPGAIGYVELAYAAPSGLDVALVQNEAGQYSRPSEATLNKTVDAGLASSADARGASLVGVPAEGTYPIAGITWLAFEPGRLGAEKGRKVVAFARWALNAGADAARRLEYVPLPPRIVAHYDSVLSNVSFTPCGAR